MLTRLRRFDEALLVRVGRSRLPWITRAMIALTRLGNAEGWALLGLFLAASGGAAAGHAWRLGLAAVLDEAQE